MRVKVLMAVLVIASVTSVCRAGDFSFSGTFTSENQVQYFTFTVAPGSHVVLQSYSYAGGTNAKGELVARGGFDPSLTLFQGVTNAAPLFKASDDEFGCTHIARDSASNVCYDAYFEATAQSPDPAHDVVAPLAPGVYVVALTNYGNFPAGVTLGDGFSNGGSAINCESYPRTFIAGTFPDCIGNARDGHWALDIKGADRADLGIVSSGLTVLSPNGGEIWTAGTSQTITWSSFGMTGTVNIALLKGGLGYKSIATNVPVDAASYTWTLPNSLPAGTDYTVRVMSSTSQKPIDISNGQFSVQPSPFNVKVLLPNGGESWTAGSTQTITWTAGVTGNVNIALLKAGIGYRAIATVPAAQGSYTWTIPASLPVASDYTIRIMSATDSTILDKSNASFSIAPSLIGLSVASPNGGETWKQGVSQTITWNATGITGNVNVALLKAGVGYKSIATNIPASMGSLTWTLPTTVPVGSDYTVRVMTIDGTLIDVSNAAFSVAQ